LDSVEYDCDAWQRYPQHRWVFNKLDLSLKLGYLAGPGGTSVPIDGDYIVRPIINLSGMGVGANRMQINKGDYTKVPPGYFWCEYFHGPNYTVDYEWQVVDDVTILRPVFAAQGCRTSADLYRFSGWRRIDPPYFKLPTWIAGLCNVPRFNIEFIHDKIIEIHLRPGVDFPFESTRIIPLWSDMTSEECKIFERMGFQLHTNFDDADGHLAVKRLGFYYK